MDTWGMAPSVVGVPHTARLQLHTAGIEHQLELGVLEMSGSRSFPSLTLC